MVVPQTILDQLNLSPEEQNVLNQWSSNQDIINGYLWYSQQLQSQSWLDDINKVQNDLSNQYLDELSNSPWLSSIKSKTRASVDTGDVDLMVKKMRDARDTIYAQLVKDADDRGITVNPLELLQIAKQQESIYNNQINDMIDIRQQRYQSADDIATEMYDEKMGKLKLLKESLGMIAEQKKEVIDQIKEWKADYRKIASLEQEERKLQKQYDKEAKDFNIKTMDMYLKNQQAIDNMDTQQKKQTIDQFWNPANITNKGSETDRGLDIAAPIGTFVPTPVWGTIKSIKQDPKDWNVQMQMVTDDGYTVTYNHLSEDMLKYTNLVGSRLQPGQNFMINWNTWNVKSQVNWKWVRLRKDWEIAWPENNYHWANMSFDAEWLLASGRWAHVDVRIITPQGTNIRWDTAMNYLKSVVKTWWTKLTDEQTKLVNTDINNYVKNMWDMSKESLREWVKAHLEWYDRFKPLSNEDKYAIIDQNVNLKTSPELSLDEETKQERIDQARNILKLYKEWKLQKTDEFKQWEARLKAYGIKRKRKADESMAEDFVKFLEELGAY